MANAVVGGNSHQFALKTANAQSLFGLGFHIPAIGAGGQYPPSVAALNVTLDTAASLKVIPKKGYLNGPQTLVNTTGNGLTVEIWDGDPAATGSLMITRLIAGANADAAREFAAPWIFKRALWIKVSGTSPGGRLCLGAAY